MQKIKIVIVEDELVIAMDLRGILEPRGYDVCAVAKTYDQGIEAIEQHRPDLVLIDIVIKGDRDGIDLATTIKNNYELPFIFITSHSDPKTLERAKQVDPPGYLLKPFSDNDVFVAIEMTLHSFNQQMSSTRNESFLLNNSLFIRQKNMTIKLEFDDIRYISADNNYSIIHTKDRNHTLRSTLKEVAAKLPASQFFRAHKSYLINLRFMTALNNAAVFIDDFEIPLGRGQHQELMKLINKL